MNQIFFFKNMTNKLNYINGTVKDIINKDNNLININNKNPIKNNVINSFDKNIINNIKLKSNPRQRLGGYGALTISNSDKANLLDKKDNKDTNEKNIRILPKIKNKSSLNLNSDFANIPNSNFLIGQISANHLPNIGAVRNMIGPHHTLNDSNNYNNNYITNNCNQINNNSDNNKIINKNTVNIDYLIILKEFLIKECKIPESKLDRKGDCLDGWRENDKSGPPGYLKDYIPPKGWKGVGLKVKGIYDDGNNAWLGHKKKKGEWYICYHGTRKKKSIKEIIENNFEPGPRQKYENIDNENPLNNFYKEHVGNGIYFAKIKQKNMLKLLNIKNINLELSLCVE